MACNSQIVIVDTQCHVSTVWYEPIETLLAQMDRVGVAQALLIQMLGELDNTYQQACTARYPDRFASVVAVDAAGPDACANLAMLAREGAAGVRLKPETRSPGSDPLAIWRTAAELELPVSCVGSAQTFGAPDFLELIAALPELTVVLEHLGGTSQAGLTDIESRRRVLETAVFPNVYLKLPGLGELVTRPVLMQSLEPEPGTTPANAPEQQPAPKPMHALMPVPELELALERFGPERLMWGSDFPVVGSREGYANALAWTRRIVAAVGPGAEASVFGGTARRVFKLN